MRVYLKVNESLCNNPGKDIKYCALEDHDRNEENDSRFLYEPEEVCNGFDRALGRSCLYCKRDSKTICKSIKNIEITKCHDPFFPGDVTIGRSTYRLEDIETLKVDYEDGKGFITEWGEEFLEGE